MQIRTSPDHRKCKYPGCSNILSIYNHEAYCNVHLNASFWKDRVNGVPTQQPEHGVPKVK